MLILKGFVKVILAARVAAPACPSSLGLSRDMPFTAPEPQGLPGELCGPHTYCCSLCISIYSKGICVPMQG